MENVKNLRAFLLNANYPVGMIAKMSDEEVVSEYEVITGDNSVPSPIY
ncbi:hypothetical protein [Thalassobacillus sp. CUG 92003]|nr:hypothetical protein [Thalassobacillus sp. CUG 92003]